MRHDVRSRPDVARHGANLDDEMGCGCDTMLTPRCLRGVLARRSHARQRSCLDVLLILMLGRIPASTQCVFSCVRALPPGHGALSRCSRGIHGAFADLRRRPASTRCAFACSKALPLRRSARSQARRSFLHTKMWKQNKSVRHLSFTWPDPSGPAPALTVTFHTNQLSKAP